MTTTLIPAAISVEHLTVRLGTTVALRDVSLSVRSGELLAIAGPNGSGKTTLIRTVLGLVSPDKGQIFLAGVPAGRLSLSARARHLAWMPQEELPGDNVTLFEYVLFGRHPHVPRFGGESAGDRLAARKALDEVGLGDRAGDRTWEISGGERQRLRLARVFAQSTPALLLDEPTAHLDMAHQLEVLERVRRLCHREGSAAVTALHDLNLAARFADRVAVLHHGRLVADGPAAAVLSPVLLQEVWGIVADLREDPRSGVPYLIPRLPPEAPRVPFRTPPLRVHVVGGGGSASPILRRLWERGFFVTSGVVALFDTDHTTAEEFGIPVATEVPFAPLSDESRTQHRRLLVEADRIVVAPFPVGPGNLANLEDLVPFAGRTPIFLLGMASWPHRDFTGGTAAAVRDRLVAAGARSLESPDDLLRELEPSPTSAGTDGAEPHGAAPALAS
ncbi:MAG: ABC transporter ATP-binding protein [Thermoplasmata archaeon]|nr:ABC transporter ATP-binding protein [Thermoplasmata archaeon]